MAIEASAVCESARDAIRSSCAGRSKDTNEREAHAMQHISLSTLTDGGKERRRTPECENAFGPIDVRREPDSKRTDSREEQWQKQSRSRVSSDAGRKIWRSEEPKNACEPIARREEPEEKTRLAKAEQDSKYEFGRDSRDDGNQIAIPPTMRSTVVQQVAASPWVTIVRRTIVNIKWLVEKERGLELDRMRGRYAHNT
jgi:hypothetical protein